MALIKCPECDKEFSEKAASCPNCGYPMPGGTTPVAGGAELQNAILLGDEAYGRDDFAEAYKYYTTVVEHDPSDYERKYRRMESSAFLISLNDKGKIAGPLAHIGEYCESVKRDEALTLEQQQEKIVGAFSRLSGGITLVHNLARKIYISDGVIEQGHVQYLEVCQFVLDNYLQFFGLLEQQLAFAPGLEPVWNQACDNCIVALQNFSARYYDKIYHKPLFLSDLGQQLCYDYAKKIAVFKSRWSPGYTLPPELVSPAEGGTGTKTGACYVATAVYGSYDCPPVWTLRRFRDYSLASTPIGRGFVRAYYAVSPTIVGWVGDSRWFVALSRRVLDVLVAKLQDGGCDSTPYEDRRW